MSQKASEAAVKAAKDGLYSYSANWIARDPDKGVMPSHGDAPKRYRNGLSSWVSFNSRGDVSMNCSAGTACHGGYYPSPGGCCIFMTTLEVQQPKLRKENRKFILWMTTESPFSVFVLNKDNEKDLVEHGVIFDSAAAGHKVSYFFAKALRFISEDTFRVKVWYDLTEKGVHPMTAFIACNLVNGSYAISKNTHNTVCCDPFTIEQLKGALTLRFDFDGNKKLKRSSDHNSFDLLWYTPSEGYWNGRHGDLFGTPKSRQEKVSDGWGGYTYKTIGGRDEWIKKLKDLTRKALGEEEENPPTEEKKEVVKKNVLKKNEQLPKRKRREEGVRKVKRVVKKLAGKGKGAVGVAKGLRPRRRI